MDILQMLQIARLSSTKYLRICVISLLFQLVDCWVHIEREGLCSYDFFCCWLGGHVGDVSEHSMEYIALRKFITMNSEGCSLFRKCSFMFKIYEDLCWPLLRSHEFFLLLTLKLRTDYLNQTGHFEGAAPAVGGT